MTVLLLLALLFPVNFAQAAKKPEMRHCAQIKCTKREIKILFDKALPPPRQGSRKSCHPDVCSHGDRLPLGCTCP
jgi:hypothetical protein